MLVRLSACVFGFWFHSSNKTKKSEEFVSDVNL
jgi:hypothetical protein